MAYQYVDHIIEEEGPCNLNGDEQPMKIEPLNQINCFDLNVDGGDEEVDLNTGGNDEGVNIENIIDLKFDGGDKGVNIEPSKQTKSFDLNSGGGDDANNPNSGSLPL